MIRLRVYLLVLTGTFVFPCPTSAQPLQTPTPPLTLDQAIQFAVDHYPTVRAAVEQVRASTAGVTVARTSYLPRLDGVWQTNIATTNNVFGQVLPQSVLPALSGPVLPATSARGVWSSAAGALMSWEPLDFGLRGATVASAEAGVTRARASETLTRLDVEAAVGSAFLNVAAAQRSVTAAQADLERREILARNVRTQVDNQLRPGADASRADAERAAARTRLIQAQQAMTVAEAILARVLGVATGPVTINVAPLLERVPAPTTSAAPAATTHPLVQVRQAAVDVAHAQEEILASTDRPRIYVQSSVFARGSGANPNGQLTMSIDGLGLDRANWAAGVQVVFPNVFDFSSLRARQAAAAATVRAETASFDEAVLMVAARRQESSALVQAARAVAANTPIQLAAARQSEAQARARFDAGLASLNELADAQSLLAQAETQDELARVDIWRALLADALAGGSLDPFLAVVRP